MTGKTHQSIGLLAVSAYYLSSVHARYEPATLGAVLVSSYFGSLLPDIDQPAAKLWQDLPFGKTVGKISDPLLSHRNITHSLLGFCLVGIGIYFLTKSFPAYWGINTQVTFICFIISYAMHLVSDMFTDEGIPLLYPWHRRFGIPPKPLHGLRIKTGKWFENLVIFPIINIVTLVLIISSWDKIKQMLFK